MYRTIETTIWRDNWFFDLSPLDKLVYIYLITSPNTQGCGVLTDSASLMATELGISRSEFEQSLERLKEKVLYTDGVIYIKHFAEYQMANSNTGNYKKFLQKSFEKLPKKTQDAILEFDQSLAKALDIPSHTDGISKENHPMGMGCYRTEQNRTEQNIYSDNEKIFLNQGDKEKEIASILLHNGNPSELDALIEEINKKISDPADRSEVARVLSVICPKTGNLWTRKLRTVDDILLNWEHICRAFEGREPFPRALKGVFGGGCSMRVEDGDLNKALQGFVLTHKLEG